MHTVWYISKYLAPPGPSTVGSRGYQLMKELAQRGHRVAIMTSDANHLAVTPELGDARYLTQDVDGMQVHWVRTMKFASAKSFRRILSWLHFEWRLLRMPRRELPRPTVIIASSLSLLSVLSGVYLSRKYRARFVFEVRDIWPLTIVEEGGYRRSNPLVAGLAAIERLGYRKADAIVGTMPNLGVHVAEVSRAKTPVYCVPMGWDASALEPAGPLPPEYLAAAVPTGRFLIGYAGTVGITNALDALFTCAESLCDDTRLHFVIVGDGDLRENYVARYGQLPNVTFVGRVPRASVQSVLAEFDLLYFSAHESRVWEYGQSLNKLIDYMLSGKPIIASYSGYPSMINEAECGIFVPAANMDALADGIRDLASLDSVELTDMGRRGRAWILEHRSYHALADRYEEILDSVSPVPPRDRAR